MHFHLNEPQTLLFAIMCLSPNYIIAKWLYMYDSFSVSSEHKMKLATVSKQIEESSNRLDFLDAAKKHLEVRIRYRIAPLHIAVWWGLYYYKFIYIVGKYLE